MSSLKGHLLVATPQLLAPLFTKSVILMIEHSEDGAMGLVLNRPTGVTVASVSSQVFGAESHWQKPILLGGPVPGPLTALHADRELANPDHAIIPGVFHTSDSEVMSALIESEAEPSQFLANYSGWSPGQLESEIEEGSWMSIPAQASNVFEADPDEIWDQIIKLINRRKLAELFTLREIPDDPRLN